jgi:hypothetical protein
MLFFDASNSFKSHNKLQLRNLITTRIISEIPELQVLAKEVAYPPQHVLLVFQLL